MPGPGGGDFQLLDGDNGGGAEFQGSVDAEGLRLSQQRNTKVRRIKSTVKTKTLSAMANRGQLRIRKKRSS